MSVSKLRGKGFLVWQLKTIMSYYPDPKAFAHFVKSLGVDWISFKVANYHYAYNQIGGNDKILLEYINALREQFISVGGWHWIGSEQPGLQGDRAEERRQKLGLAHILIDAEGELKKAWGMPKVAKAYCDKLHSPSPNFDVALCSYRFPKYHAPFPFSAFLNHDKVNANTPQVYWEGSHNVTEQLQRSIEQYDEIKYGVPFIPIGSTYGRGTWLPTVEDLEAFIKWCEFARVPGYGFYSLDWILQKDKDDWLEVIGDLEEPPPPPPPPDGLQVGDIARVATRQGYGLYTHSVPNVLDSTRNGKLPWDCAIMVDEVREVSGKIWVRSGTGWVAGWLLKEV